MIHHGELLKSAIEKSGFSVEKVAIDAGYTSKQSLYGLFKKSRIKKEILLKIDEIVTLNFKEFGFDDKDNSNELVEELRSSLEKANKIIEDLRSDKEYFKDLVKQQFQMINTKLDNLGKLKTVEGSQQKDNTISFRPVRKAEQLSLGFGN